MSQLPIVSSNGLIHVLGYSPSEGEHGVPITVRIHVSPDLAGATYVRLVVGNKALPTKVTQIANTSYGPLQLHAAAPPFDRLQSPSTKVCISIQALNEDSVILDSVPVGHFTYWDHGRRPSMASINRLPRLQIPDSTMLMRRRSIQNLPSTPSSAASDRSLYPKSPQQKTTRLRRRMKSGFLVRTKQANSALAEQEDLHASTPILELAIALDSMCADWSKAEISVGRRLVRFSKLQDGRRLIVSCEPVRQEDYCDSDTVISCIYREEVDACYVTSVDVIYLLERLTNGEFPVEEKNRIRRNLEGLKPTTVSKHKPGFGDFFQRIMDFPDPRPRNIEKDLKVFEWTLLGQALEKILSKYSIYTSDPESADSSPVDTPDSPELCVPQISYPPPDDPTFSRFLNQQTNASTSRINDCIPSNLGALANCLDNVVGDIMQTFPSPVDSASSSSASMAEQLPNPGVVEGGEPQDKDVSSWVTAAAVPGSNQNFAITDMGEFTALTSFEVMEPVHVYDYAGNPNLDYTFGYDSFALGGLSEEALNTLADHYI